ncbi:MAG: EamA family transporter RarD [Parvularculaceae bacterium]|nr:EamA family transporter RarD [Parvularculaceae bacterium]
MATSTATRTGLLAGVAAYTIWGLFPAFLKLLPATAAEIVAHRILWSIPVGALILTFARQWREAVDAIRNFRVARMLALSALLISFNWLLYVWAVVNHRVIEASLGYYINPLMLIGFGVFFLRETLSRLQIVAVALAALGVASLVLGAGVFPWVSLLLAASFGSYGFVRKTAPVGAMPGLFIETALLAPIAAIFILMLVRSGESHFGAGDVHGDVLLALAGPATVAPLVLFALAARRLPLSIMGFLQYIGPTLQLLLGLYYGETFTHAHAVAFGLIWAALALVSVDAVMRARGASQRASAIPNS